MQCLPTTVLQNTHWLWAKNLCEMFNLLDLSPECNNTFMHCETELFFCLKICPAQHSKKLTHSNKSFYCFPLTFPCSYCCFIVKYTFQHKSYTEPFIVPYSGGVDWTKPCQPSKDVCIEGQGQVTETVSENPGPCRYCSWGLLYLNTRCYASIVTKPEK